MARLRRRVRFVDAEGRVRALAGAAGWPEAGGTAGGTAADPALLSRVPRPAAGLPGRAVPSGESPPPRHGMRAVVVAVSRMAGRLRRLWRLVIQKDRGELR